jgi:hypothetical protein
MERRTPEKV